jgi:hypothetical protein
VTDNQAGFLSNSPVTLVANQSTGSPNQDNSVSVTFPNGNWPVGTAFQINLVSSANGNSAIYAQSERFNITSGGSSSATGAAASSSSASSATRPTTISMMTSTTASTIPPVTNTGGSASGSSNALPNAVTSAPSSAAVKDVYSNGALVSVLLGAAAVFGIAF